MQLTLKRERNENIRPDEIADYVPEGVEATFPYTGSLEDVITQCIGGLRSGMSYCGARTITELWDKAEFLQISPYGFEEGTPHTLQRSKQVHPDYRERFRKEITMSASTSHHGGFGTSRAKEANAD
jgi:IMP dehydrogenase/GMP reductase